MKRFLLLARARYRFPRMGYWAMLAGLTTLNAGMLIAVAMAAGLDVADVLGPTREIVVLQVAALALLFWPSFAIALRHLAESGRPAWWGVVAHAVTILLTMEIFFGKPLGIAHDAKLLNVLPLIMMLCLAAWIMIEGGMTRRLGAWVAPLIRRATS